MKMSYLIVVAHPDDEVLGAGGTIYKIAQSGREVNLCILSGKAQARMLKPSDSELEFDLHQCCKELGVQKIFMGNFPNIKLNTVPHLELVQFIEKAILETNAQTVITHHPSDVNDDHVQTSLACQAAIRLFQRRSEVVPISELWYMEVLSSTEWGINSSKLPYNPNVYIEIGKEGLEKKIKALSMYRGVMRPYPHPRSRETLEALATFRGSQSGCLFAESFQSAFRRIEYVEGIF